MLLFNTQNGILVAGGYGVPVESTCEFFDCGLNKWATVAPLSTTRYYASAATHADTVYIFGGQKPSGYSHDVEQYDYAANRWTVLQARLTVARCYASAGCVNGRIVIVGGYNGAFQSIVDCFNPVDKRLSNAPSLSHPLAYGAAASVRVSTSILERLRGSVGTKS